MSDFKPIRIFKKPDPKDVDYHDLLAERKDNIRALKNAIIIVIVGLAMLILSVWKLIELIF